MIKIIDYGLGNVLAFQNVYKRASVPVAFARTASELGDATKLILPGVGSFDHAMTMLSQSGMRDALERRVLSDGVPVLGVCVGMQMLARSSDEGKLPGLGWLDAEVKGFASLGRIDLRLPHMGWNDVRPAAGAPLFAGMEEFARFYFLHSFFFDAKRPADAAATASYGIDFCCAVSSANVHGVQFHPEKSHQCGLQLLKNFAEL